MRRTTVLLLVWVLLMGGGLLPVAQPVMASDTAVLDTPTALVNSGVTSYTLTAPKVFWYTGVPQCPPRDVAAANANQAAAQYTESISRIATYGSPVRAIYAEPRDCG